MKINYLFLFLVLFSAKSYSQSEQLPVVPASKLANISIRSGTSKIAYTSLPDSIQLAKRTPGNLYSMFTKSNASGDYYQLGNKIIRVRGIEKSLPAGHLEQLSKERFLEESDLEERKYTVINGNKVLFIKTETDANYDCMLVYVQNTSNANYLQLNVLYPANENSVVIDAVTGFLKSVKFN